jgi:hypothetical protein
MRQQFEYRSLQIPGLREEDLEEPSPDLIGQLLKDRVRTYNRLGGEGWSLVAEHQDSHDYSAVATFRRALDPQESIAPSSMEIAAAPASLPSAQAPGGQDPAYPTLQPNPTAPDTFRLVWER